MVLRVSWIAREREFFMGTMATCSAEPFHPFTGRGAKEFSTSSVSSSTELHRPPRYTSLCHGYQTKIRRPPALPYLRPEGLAFLRNLARHNDREWFTPRKAVFEAELKEPMLAIIRKVTDAMATFCAQLMCGPRRSASSASIATRASAPTRSPTRRMWPPGGRTRGWRRPPGAGYYFHIDAKEVVIAAGAYMPEKDQLAAIRHWLLDHHAEFRKLLQRPAIRKTFAEFEGNALTRPPKGFPVRASGDGPDPMPAVGTEHDAARRRRRWRRTLPATLMRHFRLAAPVVDALNTPIAGAFDARRERCFSG